MATVKKRHAKLFHYQDNEDSRWQPSVTAVIKLLLSIRISAAVWAFMNSNDDVYDNWEPLHFLLYGNGFHTRNLSAEYFPRSYSNVAASWIPGRLLVYYFDEAKIAVFTLIRLVIGSVCLGGEYYAYSVICRRINIPTGRFFILFTIFSSGMFHASVSFSQFSLSMICSLYFLGAFLDERRDICIICVVISTFVGWPFTVVLGFPILLDMIWRRMFVLPRAFGASIIIIASVVFIDKTLHGEIYSSAYHSLKETFVDAHGHEATVYYLWNFFLNWNFAMFYAPLGLILSFKAFKELRLFKNVDTKYLLPHPIDLLQGYFPIMMLAFPNVLWFLMFGCLSQKEERFMFPIYPYVAFFSALAADATCRLTVRKIPDSVNAPDNGEKKEDLEVYLTKESLVGMSKEPRQPVKKTKGLVPEKPGKTPKKDEGNRRLVYNLIGLFAVLSIMRVYSVHDGHGSSMEIYKGLHQELNAHEEFDRFYNPIRVCLGKEWLHFPSSFFLPQQAYDGKLRPRRVELRFLKSVYRSTPQEIQSQIVFTANRHLAQTETHNEEVSKYVSLDSCDYVIDMDMPGTEVEPDFTKMLTEWKPIFSMPFVDYSRSHIFLKHFYIPYFSKRFNFYTTYSLYRRAV